MSGIVLICCVLFLIIAFALAVLFILLLPAYKLQNKDR